jgi:D-alanyl-D-alanine carboxypeptidase
VNRQLHSFVDRSRVPGAVAALVTADDLEVHVAGVRRRGAAPPVTEDDQWHIGSCGKSITAVLYGRLVDLGLARWGVPIRDLFADLGDEVHPDWGSRPVDEVFHCRAGVAADLDGAHLRRALNDRRPLVEQRTEAAAVALRRAPTAPGRFVYSNLGYIVIGAAIDRLTGTSYEQALRTHLQEPLGLTSLGFGPPPAVWGHGPRIQLGGLCAFRGTPAPPTSPASDNAPVLSSAGTMHLSVRDWAAFQRQFLSPAPGRIVTPETVEHILSVPAGPGVPMAMGWARADRVAGVAYGMQGSNTMWSACALLNDRRDCTALVIANDGRTSVLTGTAKLAVRLLLDR